MRQFALIRGNLQILNRLIIQVMVSQNHRWYLNLLVFNRFISLKVTTSCSCDNMRLGINHKM